MSRKKKSNTFQGAAISTDESRIKWGKCTAYMLWGLVGEIFFCLICGWLFGNTEFNAIEDNFLTAFLQNYNYILAALILIPVIAYIYSRIKQELIKKFINDDQILMYGFGAVVVVFIAIITICSIVYPINSSTWYGLNSAGTVCVFLCSVITLILESIVYLALKISSLTKTKGELWKNIKKYLPIILMIMFLIWTFISCMLAPGAADDVIGSKVAEDMGAAPDDVLSKTLNGCYNLKDGYWAFLMYGSFMLAAMLIGKEQILEKKKLIIGFVIVITLLSVISLFMSGYHTAQIEKYDAAYDQYYYHDSGEYEFDTELTKMQFYEMALNKAYELFNRIYIYPQRAIFRNSNHFAYVLCMAIIAAAGLALVEKKMLYKILYLACFAVMTCMLIVNDTFGGYLGVMVALIALVIYSIANMFVKRENVAEHKNEKWQFLAFTIAIVAIFVALSLCVKNSRGETNAVRNIENFVRDIGIFGGYMISEENATQADIGSLDESITTAGSGRGETWIKVWELIKQRPLFGYGLECLLFQFSGQFNINEGRTHNLLLQLLATVGIPGTLMYFAALAIVFIRLLKNWKTWNYIEFITTFVGISYMVTALTGNSTYYTSPYFMMFLGFVVLTPWKRENSKE